jgi:hypothetical protein
MIEILESRIAPASLVLTDVDGDKVTFTTSKGALDASLVTKTATLDGLHTVFAVDLSLGVFADTNLTVAVTKGGGGDGKAIVGHIEASPNLLGTVKITGDLGSINTGTGTFGTGVALKSLTVDSMGRYAGSAGYVMNSTLRGDVGSFVVKGDVSRVNLYFPRSVDSISIGGSLIGGGADGEGSISVRESLGKLAIKGDVRAGGGQYTGDVVTGDNLGTVSIGGSIYGGLGDFSGAIVAGQQHAATITKVTVGGSVIGSIGESSGVIGNRTLDVSGGTTGLSVTLLSATIAGDVVGGTGIESGRISGLVEIGKVKIKGDLVGGKGDRSGIVGAGAKLAGVAIGGAIQGGAGIHSGAIIGGLGEAAGVGTITQVTVAGSVIGGAGDQSGQIGAKDGSVQRIEIGGVTIGGDLAGGSGMGSGAIFGNLGKVVIKKDLRGGSAQASGSVLAGFRIDSVAIGGSIFGAAGEASGSISVTATNYAPGTINTITVGGSVIGGGGFHSGSIFDLLYSGGISGPQLDIGSITIGKDLVGGSGPHSGEIDNPNPGDLDSLTVKGSVIGGSGTKSGGVSWRYGIGIVTIGGSLIGRSGASSGALFAAHFDAITIGGSLLGGESLQAGSIFVGSMVADGVIDRLKIRGDVRGSTGELSGSISAASIGLKLIGGAIIRGTGTNSGNVG